jgi:hypothetical protein
MCMCICMYICLYVQVYGGLGDEGLLVKLNAVSDTASLLAPDSLLLNALGRYILIYIYLFVENDY